MFDAWQKAKAKKKEGILSGLNASGHEPQLADYYGPLKLTRPKEHQLNYTINKFGSPHNNRNV